jgi:hypothetical protein
MKPGWASLAFSENTEDRSMPVPVSTERRQATRSLLDNGLDNKQIASQPGVSPGQVASVKAHMTMGTYDGGENGAAAEAEVASAADTAFGLEKDLQLALRRSIEQLETGLPSSTVIGNKLSNPAELI